MLYRLDKGFGKAVAVSQLSAQCSSLVSPDPVSFAAGLGSDSGAHLSHVPKKGGLLVCRPQVAFSSCFLPLIPWDIEGLGQAAVLNVAGVGASVLRGDLHHHPGLVRAIFSDVFPP